jgi:dienelactone hydrolase
VAFIRRVRLWCRYQGVEASMNGRRVWALAALLAVFGLGAANAQGPEPAAAVKPRAVVEAERDLWRPGEARYLRRWRVKAVDAPLAEEAALTPEAPGQAAWATNTAWTDQVGLADQAGGDGTAQAPRYAYAFTTIARDEAGVAELALGAQGAVKVWINGRLAGEAASEAPGDGAFFVYDRVRLPVRLEAGENRLLVRIENRGGGWLLAARLLTPNQPLPDVRLQPAIWADGGDLKVRTDVTASDAPAEVTVLAPGGRAMVRVEVRRGETAGLSSAAWPDGPYDVRVASRDVFGQPLLAFAPWFKGDMTAAARALLAKARAASGSDAEAGHWRMLGDLVTDRAGADLSRIGSAWGPVHSALMEAAEMELGPAAAARSSGFVRLAWIDPIDGSTQFCRAYLPAGYDPSRAWPTVLMLHGAHPLSPPYIRYWGVDSRHHPAADRWPILWIEPHGRGNSGYIGLGEKDVLNCLDAARTRLKVDASRTYLTGGSMGGMGTWRVGTHNVDAFAAIAPVFGGADLRLHPSRGLDNPAADRPIERWTAESQPDFAGAEQLRNTPVFVHHGDQDQAVDVRFSRHIVGLMQRWGYDVRYHEHPGLGHEDLGETDEIVGWFLEHSKVAAPREARVRAVDLAAARAAWLRVDGAMVPMAMIEADAAFTQPGTLRLDTRNVARLTLSPPASLRAGTGPLKVVWNGRPVEIPPTAGGQFVLVAPDAPQGAQLKRPGLSGSVFDVFATPFVIVTGTTAKDPEMRRIVRERAEGLAGLWTALWGARPRIVDDRQLTPDMEAGLSLVLIGGPDDNAVVRRLAGRLPLKVARDGVTIDGRRFAASDAYAVMVRPSPLAPDRYVMTVAGTSAAGLFLWDPITVFSLAQGGLGNPYDWMIVDGRQPVLAKGLAPERGWIAAGMFDQAWRRDDRWTFLGDPAPRAAAPLKTRPVATAVLPRAVMDRYVGRYLYNGGPMAVTVRREDDALMLDPPQGMTADRLLPQGEARFRLASDGSPVAFRLGPDGAPVEAVVGTGDQATIWRRAP